MTACTPLDDEGWTHEGLFYMTGQAVKRFDIPGTSEVWLRREDSLEAELVYRPAVLIELTLNFRSLRAGLNHSEERSYSAWLPESELAIDWDSPAVTQVESSQFSPGPDLSIRSCARRFGVAREDLEAYESELIDKLVRSERLRLFYNPVFGLFSAPDDSHKDFLARVAEAALGRVEPELKRLRARFELQLEQVREARSARGSQTESLSFEGFITQKLQLFESGNRIAGMFSTLAGAVFGTTAPRSDAEPIDRREAELRHDLDKIEQDAGNALRALYSEYLTLANEHDVFEIGLQPDNIQVTRRTILWVPVDSSAWSPE